MIETRLGTPECRSRGLLSQYLLGSRVMSVVIDGETELCGKPHRYKSLDGKRQRQRDVPRRREDNTKSNRGEIGYEEITGLN